MFRYLANWWVGRRKIMDEQINRLNQAVGIVESIIVEDIVDGVDVTVDLFYNRGHKYPHEVVGFLKDKFRESPSYGVDGRHQVFSGRGTERHYLDLSSKEIKATFARERILGFTVTQATIKYTLHRDGDGDKQEESSSPAESEKTPVRS